MDFGRGREGGIPKILGVFFIISHCYSWTKVAKFINFSWTDFFLLMIFLINRGFPYKILLKEIRPGCLKRMQVCIVYIQSSLPLADCPAMCFGFLNVDIAGSGDPLYVADNCNWRSYSQRRPNRPIFFCKKGISYTQCW